MYSFYIFLKKKSIHFIFMRYITERKYRFSRRILSLFPLKSSLLCFPWYCGAGRLINPSKFHRQVRFFPRILYTTVQFIFQEFFLLPQAYFVLLFLKSLFLPVLLCQLCFSLSCTPVPVHENPPFGVLSVRKVPF